MIYMNHEEMLILELCKRDCDRSLISSFVKKEHFDWLNFFDNISRHAIAPLVLDRLLTCHILESHSEILTNRAKEEILKVMVKSRLFKNELNAIQLTLQKSGIQCILLKGLSIDFFQLRTTGDIDLLIREEKLLTAINLLRKIDYKYVGDLINYKLKSKEKKNIELQKSWNNQFQLYNEKKGILLELHINLFERKRVYSVNLDTLLDNIDVFWKEKRDDKNLNCYILSHEHSLLLMCLHNALRRSPANDTFILRNLVDISSLIENGIKWENFIETCIKLNMASFVLFSLLLTNKLLDTIIPKHVVTSLKKNCTKSQLFLINIHFKCLKSLNMCSIFYSKLYNILCPFVFGNRWSDRIKWILLIPIIFPPRWKMEKYFNVAMDSPFIYFTYLINPFRWIYLVIRRTTVTRSVVPLRKKNH